MRNAIRSTWFSLKKSSNYHKQEEHAFSPLVPILTVACREGGALASLCHSPGASLLGTTMAVWKDEMRS